MSFCITSWRRWPFTTLLHDDVACCIARETPARRTTGVEINMGAAGGRGERPDVNRAMALQRRWLRRRFRGNLAIPFGEEGT